MAHCALAINNKTRRNSIIYDRMATGNHAGWRRVFAFFLNYEHSSNANNGSTRQINDDRHIASYSKSNTIEATAELGLSSARVSD